jgi:hypothetical protein
MTRFYNSGLYLTPFFTKHKEVDLTLFDNEYLHEEIEYNADLFAEYFKGGLVERCKYNPKRKINNEFRAWGAMEQPTDLRSFCCS